MYPGHDGERIIHLIVIEMTGVSAQIMLYLFHLAAILFVTMATGGLSGKSPYIF